MKKKKKGLSDEQKWRCLQKGRAIREEAKVKGGDEIKKAKHRLYHALTRSIRLGRKKGQRPLDRKAGWIYLGALFDFVWDERGFIPVAHGIDGIENEDLSWSK